MGKAPGPFASGARAAEIALMEEFGLEEFTELTGVGIGDYGIYRVGQKGVSLRASDALTSLTVEEQNAVHQLARKVTLKFPCEPATFLSWYDATRGQPSPGRAGISDFPLAEGFERTLRLEPSARAGKGGPSVASGEIISAFLVEENAKANYEWWNRRLRHPGRFSLIGARAAQGRAKIPSRWYPHVVAAWLIDRQHLSREVVVRVMEKRFEAFPRDLL